VVLRRIKQMEGEGMCSFGNTEVARAARRSKKDKTQRNSRQYARATVIYPAEKTLKEFDAAVLATGATKPRDHRFEPAASRAFTLRWNSSRRYESMLTGRRTGILFPRSKDVIVIAAATGTIAWHGDAARLRVSCR